MANEILIIDDNLDIRILISGILRDKGFRVREAANYDQALTEINKKIPDVAIIDVKLDKGDNDGIDLLTHIKKLTKMFSNIIWVVMENALVLVMKKKYLKNIVLYETTSWID